MEARQALSGSAVPKALLIVLVLCAAVILAVGASFMSKELSGPGSTTNTNVHAAPGTVLRQDWESKSAPAGSTAPVRHGSQDDIPGFRE